MMLRPAASSICTSPAGRLQVPAQMTLVTHWRRALALTLPLLLTGCGEPKITHYTVPKERAAANSTAAPAAASRPQVDWKLPEGWSQVEARVGLASFAVFGEGGQQAQVNITPLPPMQGREALIINMWRSQVGLGEIPEAEAMAQLGDVEVGGESGKIFEVASPARDGDGPQRIITAMVHRADASWFYKLAGDDVVVQAEKPRFLEFLKSIRVSELAASAPPSTARGDGGMGAPMAAASAPARKFNWQVPAGWTALPVGQMQDARFAVPDQSSSKAEVSVSVFNRPTGDRLSNINRWRGQVGLSNITETELAGAVTLLDPANPDAILLDVTNNGKRLLGAAYPRGGRYFFYKLLGDEVAVASQKEAFIKFVKSEP